MPHVIPCLFLTNFPTVVIGVSICGNVRNATKLPQYVVATTITTNHHVPTTIRPLSALGRYKPPCCNKAP